MVEQQEGKEHTVTKTTNTDATANIVKVRINELDANERPPDSLRRAFKRFQRLNIETLDPRNNLPDDNDDNGEDEEAVNRVNITDLQTLNPDQLPDGLALEEWTTFHDDDNDDDGDDGGDDSHDGRGSGPGAGALRKAFEAFLRYEDKMQSQCHHNPYRGEVNKDLDSWEKVQVLTHSKISGLKVISGMLPPAVQLALLSRIFHRDLSDPRYKTNVHLHYKMKYPCSDAKNRLNGYHDETISKLVLQNEDHSSSNSSSGSFFRVDPALILKPQDETVHKPMTIRSFLDKRLRWITLGPQYNWTLKEYPAELPPPFPEDIATLLRVAFPETIAEAGIVNIYSPGDALSVHRDVSEECDEGLISVSIGCSALFLISHDNEEGCEVFKLRSGDVIYMTGKSRFAWHAVPKVVAGTCPSWLRNWPSDPVQGRSDFDQWSGWMERKRINFNVRQVKGGDFSR